jgi:hypothetical protein
VSKNAWLQYGQNALTGFDINDVPRIVLDALKLTFNFYDGNGVPRCEIGNLPPRGISAGGYGFRVNGADGSPLYDSTGVIAVASLLANSTLQNALYVGTGYTNRVDMTVNQPQQATFTLTRPGNVLFLTKTTGNTTGATENWAYTTLSVTGHALGGVGQWDKANAGYTSDSSFVMWSLPAGTFVAKLQASADVGQTLGTVGGGIDAILMGG